jgi:chromosome segregation ATPase
LNEIVNIKSQLQLEKKLNQNGCNQYEIISSQYKNSFSQNEQLMKKIQQMENESIEWTNKFQQMENDQKEWKNKLEENLEMTSDANQEEANRLRFLFLSHFSNLHKTQGKHNISQSTLDEENEFDLFFEHDLVDFILF